ncbi:MAG TPA: amidase [Bryobacteraceae bacterium]|jgi:aspartyl-tRNA(Asn)/glutamyl-tRNA(Gln) amidotransferase subunit A|nr:amidase [Bryobacteraceae bacterium]
MPNSSRRGFLAAGLGALTAAHLARADSSGELAALTLKQASDRIRSRKVSPVELTEACLDRIKTYNPKINAWITVMREKALAQAKSLAEEQSAGRFRSPLHGIPIGLKDSIDTVGTRTTAASAVYEYRFPAEDAEVVRRLKAAGAVLIGKCNMHEFDAGATSAVSYWGPVRNPWNLERVSGGASGGSAAAVAMENCFGALGTDAGGAIRTPSSHCGVVGFKPTFGRVSMRGVIPFAWSLDHCGPIARTVEDAALLLQQIGGYDRMDVDSADQPLPDYSAAIGAPVAQFRIGLAPQFFDHLDDDVSRAIEDAIALLNKMTKGSHEVGLPSLLHAGVGAEIAAFHENLRGVNGGGYEPSTARVFPTTTDATRAADYIRGWRDLELVRRTVDEDVFRNQNVDLLLAPTARHAPPTIEEELIASGAGGGGGGRGGGANAGGLGGVGGGRDGAANATRTRAPLDLEENTRPFNGYGLPTISLPCGFTKDGLPIGMQISGPHFGEMNVLALAHAYQEATDWHKRRPPLQPDTKVPVLSKAASEQTGG